MITSKVPHILYGGDYNPEQWPEAVWQEDVRLMREAGVNLVTVGVFSWARLEPRPETYDFAWLDRVMDLLHEHGVMVNLATATASPPPWMAREHPESLPVSREDTRLWPGGRQQYCPSSPVYRASAASLVRQLAERYRDHPALAMWHINNEYGCHVSACYCDVSAADFREWLKQRYGTLDALNVAWGTAFWSQRYSEWEEIVPPRSAPTFPNPTQQLDFQRFTSDALLYDFEMERAIIREVTPEVPVTTNFMGFFKPVDYWKWAEREDVVSDDAYPDPADPQSPALSAMRYDLMRSLAGTCPWMLMEQTPSQVNWRPWNALKRPGQLRTWSLQAIARGADGVLYFQWRASAAGAEKFHGGAVPHIGTERSRVFREVADLGHDLARLDGVLGTRPAAEVAVVLDWESWWALELDSHPSADVKMLDQLQRYYLPLYARNIPVDFVRPEADLTGYKVVLVPNLYLVRDGVAERFEQFVSSGGQLVMSFFSGIVDEHDHVRLGGYPAPFRRVLGVRVEEFDPYVPGQRNTLLDVQGQRYICDLWSDVMELEGAEVLATFGEDFYAGRPAITRHAFGQGNAYYLGTRPEPAYMEQLLADVCVDVTRPPFAAPPGVEVVRRAKDDGSWWFLLNHTPQPVEVTGPDNLYDALTGNPVGPTIQLAPYGAVVLIS